MAIFLADMPPLPPRPPKQHAQISWLAKGGRFYLFSLSRRSHDETSFGSCSGGEDVAPLALLASLGLTTTLVHEKKHEGQHRGKNDRRASQDIKVVRGHAGEGEAQHRRRPALTATSPAFFSDVGGSLQTQRPTEGVPSAGLHAERPHELAAERPIARGPGSTPHEAHEQPLCGVPRMSK